MEPKGVLFAGRWGNGILFKVEPAHTHAGTGLN